jgi:hypothetical protein
MEGITTQQSPYVYLRPRHKVTLSSGDVAPHIMNINTGCTVAVSFFSRRFIPGKELPAPTAQEAG